MKHGFYKILNIKEDEPCMHKYFCEVCGWEGDIPETYDIYGDGGYPICPNSVISDCCTEIMEYQSGSGVMMPIKHVIPVYENSAHPGNMMRFLKAIYNVKTISIHS
jgi:hypothetical protein